MTRIGGAVRVRSDALDAWLGLVANSGFVAASGNPGSWLSGTTGAFTLFMVYKLGSVTDANAFAIGSSSGHSVLAYVSANGSINEIYGSADRGSTAVGGVANRSVSSTGLHKFVYRFNAGTLDLFHNSDAKVTGSPASFSSIGADQFRLLIGFSGFAKDLTLYETHLYAGAASDADCAALISYAATKHGS